MSGDEAARADFAERHPAFLDEPGEWYLDTTAGTLYYKPLAGQDLASARVEPPRLETLIEVGGTYDEPAHGLSFEGVTFTGTAWPLPSSPDGYANQQTGAFVQDGIFASYVTRLTIAHNEVSDMPYTGTGIGYGWAPTTRAAAPSTSTAGSTTSSRSTTRPPP